MPDEEHLKSHGVRRALGAPVWPLYHGTSTHRLRDILHENRLRRFTKRSVRKVSLTTDPSVARYFAYLAALRDRKTQPGARPAVLVIDGDGLIEAGYDLESHSDPEHGAGLCDWDKEIACRQDIKGLDRVLLGVQKSFVTPLAGAAANLELLDGCGQASERAEAA